MVTIFSNRLFILGSVAALSAAIFAFDPIIPLGFAGGVPYLIPVLVTYRLTGTRATLWTAVVCSVLTLIGLHYSPEGGAMWQVLMNRTLTLFVIWGTAWFVLTRKQAENILRRYQHIVSSSSDFLAYIDKEYKYQAVNNAYLRAFGKTRPEIVGKNVEQILGAGGFKIARPYLERCLSGESVNFQYYLKFPKTGTRFLDVHYDPHLSVDGSIEGIIDNIRDITARKQAEEALRRRTEHIKLLGQVTRDANRAATLDEAMQYALDNVCAYNGWPVGHAYVRSKDSRNVLVPTDIWHLDAPKRFSTFREVTEKAMFEPGVGLPGRVMASGAPAGSSTLLRTPTSHELSSRMISVSSPDSPARFLLAQH